MRIAGLILSLLVLNVLIAQQPADMIRPGMLQMKYLPEGTHSYLVYIKTYWFTLINYSM